jgi:nuclear pore complex protein Nup98-Nup96
MFGGINTNQSSLFTNNQSNTLNSNKFTNSGKKSVSNSLGNFGTSGPILGQQNTNPNLMTPTKQQGQSFFSGPVSNFNPTGGVATGGNIFGGGNTTGMGIQNQQTTNMMTNTQMMGTPQFNQGMSSNQYGTFDIPYSITLASEQGQGNKNESLKMIAITAITNYSSKSIEELRKEDYALKKQGRIHSKQNQFGGLTGNINLAGVSSGVTQGGNMLGNQQANMKVNIFGTSSGIGGTQQQTGTSLFGNQNKTVNMTNTQTGTQGNIFGQGGGGVNQLGGNTNQGMLGINQGNQTNQTNQTKQGVLFGNTSNSGGVTNQQGGIFNTGVTTNQTGGLFGGNASQQTNQSMFNTSNQPTGNMFNSGTQQVTQGGGLFTGTGTTQQTGGGLFTGATTNQQANQGGGLFAGTATVQQTGGGLFNTSTQQQSGGLFGGTQTTTQPQTGGLFGAQTTTQPQAGGLFGSTQQATQSSGGLFGPSAGGKQTSAFSTQGGGLFAGNQTQTGNTQLFQGTAMTQPQTGLFASNPTAQPSGLFGPTQPQQMIQYPTMVPTIPTGVPINPYINGPLTGNVLGLSLDNFVTRKIIEAIKNNKTMDEIVAELKEEKKEDLETRIDNILFKSEKHIRENKYLGLLGATKSIGGTGTRDTRQFDFLKTKRKQDNREIERILQNNRSFVSFIDSGRKKRAIDGQSKAEWIRQAEENEYKGSYHSERKHNEDAKIINVKVILMSKDDDSESFDMLVNITNSVDFLKETILDKLHEDKRYKRLTKNKFTIFHRSDILLDKKDLSIYNLKEGDKLSIAIDNDVFPEPVVVSKKRRQEGDLASIDIIPVLTKPGYHTKPSYPLICRMTVNQLKSIEGFQIYNDYGLMKFLHPVDLRGLNLDQIVTIEPQKASLYEHKRKPPRGQGLNVECEIHLYDIQSEEGLSDFERQEFKDGLERAVRSKGAKMVRFDEHDNTLIFTINELNEL